MPMIIKNGRKYCTSSTLADDVIYDNTNSGLRAGTVGEAIDELATSVTELNSNLNMRYNPKTDTVQIYYNGQWNDWEKANLIQ